ncbi:MAG: trypsin-like peptidase domain-containing protein [Halanaerobium sp.]|nr:trypsin-like peptidase domain-containing protein [Halanaerobium sp.]
MKNRDGYLWLKKWDDMFKFAAIIVILMVTAFTVFSVVGMQANVQAGNSFIIPQEEAVKKVVKEDGPAVVSVMTEKVDMGYDMFLNPVPRTIEGLGSGFIFDRRGYILTNNHVVAGAKDIKVHLQDGREFTAELIGADARNDLAVIKIEGENLPTLEFGDSESLEVGQLAIAIGSPYDINFQNTVTTGVVSALNRTIRTEKGNLLEGLIQTDASINPGNSGGPLLNSQGEVIGINTAILGSAQGIGFAIPSATAKAIIDDLIKYGKVKRPWLGIYGAGIDDKVASYYNLPVDHGVLILQIIPDSPADRAGLSNGDIIMEVDRNKIEDMDNLQKVIMEKGIGTEIKVLIMRGRDGKIVPVSVKLGEAPTQEELQKKAGQSGQN